MRELLDAAGNPVATHTWVIASGVDNPVEVVGTRPEGVAIIRNPAPGHPYTSTISTTVLVRLPRLWAAYLTPPRGDRQRWLLRVNDDDVEVPDVQNSREAMYFASGHLAEHHNVLARGWRYVGSSDRYCIEDQAPFTRPEEAR